MANISKMLKQVATNLQEKNMVAKKLSTEPLAFELIPELSLGPESSLVNVQV